MGAGPGLGHFSDIPQVYGPRGSPRLMGDLPGQERVGRRGQMVRQQAEELVEPGDFSPARFLHFLL